MSLDALVEEVASLPLPDDDSPEAWEVFTDRRASLVEQIQQHVEEWGAESLSAESRSKLLLSLNQRLEQVAVVQSERKSEIQEQRDKRFQLANYRNRRKASRGYSRGSAYA